MVILDLEVLDTNLTEIVENIKHQKDAQRNSVQKEVLNSSPSFFSTSFAKTQTLIATNNIRIKLVRICFRPIQFDSLVEYLFPIQKSSHSAGSNLIADFFDSIRPRQRYGVQMQGQA